MLPVISRCQDAIKAMTDEHKFTGRLSVRQVIENKNKSEIKYQSPLRRIPVVRFQFTTPAKISEDTDVFTLALDKILQRIGVLRDNIDEVTEAVVDSSFADEETAVQTIKARKSEVKGECEECKRRKMKTFTDVGSQCVDSKGTVSIGVQVLEEDFTKGFIKNDSIAFLTPAQLLGKDKDKGKELETPSPITNTAILKKDKPRTPPVRGRGRGRGRGLLIRERSFNNTYDYQRDEYYDDFYDNGRDMCDDNFDGTFERYERQDYMEEDHPHTARLHQFREEEGHFMDFSQPYRGGPRGGRYGGSRF